MKNLKERIRGKSTKELFCIFLSKCLKTRIDEYNYLALDIDKYENYIFPDIPNVRELRFEDFLKGDRKVFFGKKLDIIKERLSNNNYKAYGIVKNDILIYSTWISVGKLTMPNGQQFHLKDSQGLLEDSYCAPDARGKGLHSKMNLFRINMFKKLGIKEVVAIVLDGNTPALKVQMKSKFDHKFNFKSGYILGIPFTTKIKR